MKLKSCYIENYGKIKKSTFEFSDGMTCFCEANGYGKSTLASFIKAMFYGLDSYRQNSKDFCDRQHFCPFDGGKFGGYLIFTKGGKEYKIERYFVGKSGSDDTLKVYCNNTETDELGDKIGEAVFGIDKESFEKTVFIDSNSIEISTTGSINSKLNGFALGSDDSENVEQAIKRLQDKASEYKKKKSGNDLITKVKEQIKSLDENIENLQTISKLLPAKYEEYNGITQKIADTEKRIAQVQKSELILKDWEQYDSLCKKTDEWRVKSEEIKKKYPFGMPEEGEIETVKSRIAEGEKIQVKTLSSAFPESDEKRLSALEEKFVNGVPSEEELKATEDKIDRLSRIQTETALNGESGYGDRERELIRKFAAGEPTEADISHTEEKLEKFRQAEKEYNLTPSRIAETVYESTGEKGKGGFKGFIPVAIVAAALLLGGVVCLFFQTVVAAVLLVCGGATLICDGFIYLNKKAGAMAESRATVVEKDNPEKREKERLKDLAEDGVKAFLLPYGYSSEEGVVVAFASFRRDYSDYLRLKSRDNERKDLIGRLKREEEELKNALNLTFGTAANAGADYRKSLTQLRADIADYDNLRRRKQSAEKQIALLRAQLQENNLPVIAYCKKYGVAFSEIADKIAEAEKDVRDEKYFSSLKAKSEEEAEAFRREKCTAARPEGECADSDSLNEELHALQERKNSVERDISDDEAKAEQLDYLLARREELDEKLKEYTRKYELILSSVSYLNQAEAAIKDRYIRPIKERFAEYAVPVEKTLGEELVMNGKFEIRFVRNGEERDERHLSAGQKSICAFSFRLALIDNMYTKEKPFLILDDPFVGLDSVHLDKMRAVINQVARGMQIIYFSCHESRKM